MVRALSGLLGVMLAFSFLLPVVAQGNPQRGGAPDSGHPPSPGMGGETRHIGATLDDLQKELSLSADQREQINAIAEKTLVSVFAYIGEARHSGDPQGLESLRSEFGNIAGETTRGIMDVLTHEQREKFSRWVGEHHSQWQFPGDVGVPFPSPERRARRAVEALKIADVQEAEAVQALVARIIKLQGELEAFYQASWEKAGEILKGEGGTDQALEERLHSMHSERKALEARLRQTQEELASVVTARQELELYRQHIFR